MKYRFEVIYRNKYMSEANKFMKALDLGIEEMGIKEYFEFTGNDFPIQELKERLKWALNECEIEVLHIEGGKIE